MSNIDIAEAVVFIIHQKLKCRCLIQSDDIPQHPYINH